MKVVSEKYFSVVTFCGEQFTRRTATGRTPIWIDESGHRIRDLEHLENLEALFAARNLPTPEEVFEATAVRGDTFEQGVQWMAERLFDTEEDAASRGLLPED